MGERIRGWLASAVGVIAAIAIIAFPQSTIGLILAGSFVVLIVVLFLDG